MPLARVTPKRPPPGSQLSLVDTALVDLSSVDAALAGVGARTSSAKRPSQNLFMLPTSAAGVPSAGLEKLTGKLGPSPRATAWRLSRPVQPCAARCTLFGDHTTTKTPGFSSFCVAAPL